MHGRQEWFRCARIGGRGGIAIPLDDRAGGLVLPRWAG